MSELEDHYDPQEVESRVKEKWETEDVYERVKDSNKDGKDFYFVDGPPFTSGRMHCGTAWGKVLKDVFLRYYRMTGRNVLARPGYDTHGLPIEVKVEDKHGFDNKMDIEEYGVEEFIEECQEYVYEQKSVMDEEFSDLGVWMDWDNPYLTMNKDYMDTVWSTFSALYDENLVSRGFDVLNTCPRCETTLSDSELEYDYRNVTATYVGFELKNEEGVLVTWTTTPWTVAGHQFVAVDENTSYSKVVAGETNYYVATDCVEDSMSALGYNEYTVENEVTGEQLVGKEYHHPLDNYVESLPDVNFTVEHADYVETEKTGLVHSAPGFGHEDYERGQELELHPFSPVGVDGKFTGEAGTELQGEYVHDRGADKVMRLLDSQDSLLATEKYDHEYPHCPRCDTDVVFRATEQWMVEVTDMKEELQDAIGETSWYPSEARDERFRNTVKNAPNWNISRQRYWGTPIPVWVCEDCGSDNVVETAEELVNRTESLDETPSDLHRPSVDSLNVECSSCGSTETSRVEDVLDVWFDSSVASWGSLGVKPNENPSPESWPADLIVEGHDQTRGWFLMQLYQGVGLTGKAPYDDVLMHGFALLDGEPMSKSRGHVLRPPEVIDEHGRDALRTYMLSNEQQENDVNMTSDMQGVSNMQQNLDVVWNVYRFALMYMNADGYTAKEELSTSQSERTTLDNWVLSQMESAIEKSSNGFESRQPHRALQSTMEFLVEDVSRYYVKTVRDRVWSEEQTTDKSAAYDTLSTVLSVGTKLLAPFAPYLSEELYESMPLENTEFSVHAEEWPETDGLRNKGLENSVEMLQNVEETVARARDRVGRKKRWALDEVVVESGDRELQEVVEEYSQFLKDRVNTNSLTVTDSFEETVETVRPKMSRLGPEFGEVAQEVAEKVRDEKVTSVPLTVEVEDGEYKVTNDMVETVEELPSDTVKAEGQGMNVYVDTRLNEEITVEGYARDLVRKCQQLRGELELDMEEYVSLEIETDSETVEKALNDHGEYLRQEVRVNQFSVSKPELTENCDLNGEEVRIQIQS